MSSLVAIYRFIVDLYTNLLQLFKNCFMWIIETAQENIEPSLEQVDGIIPNMQPYWQQISVTYDYWWLINQWFPLDLAITLLAVWYTYLVCMVIIKLVVKLFIPMVG